MLPINPLGLHTDISAKTYHLDEVHDRPTLSSSIAKVLLAATPRHAWFAHPRLNPDYKADEEDKFSLGSVAHELILGKGGGFDILEFDDWRTKDAKASKETSRKNGRTPILRHQADRAIAVQKAVEERLPPDWFDGQSEVVAVWDDAGTICRAMYDKLCQNGIIWDIKTTDNGLSNNAIARTIANLSYDLSAAFYLRGLTQLRPELAGRAKFYWLFVEVNEPYECRIIEADATTLEIGRRKADYGINLWHTCLRDNHWPGYPNEISRITYPAFAENAWIEREIKESEAA